MALNLGPLDLKFSAQTSRILISKLIEANKNLGQVYQYYRYEQASVGGGGQNQYKSIKVVLSLSSVPAMNDIFFMIKCFQEIVMNSP